MPHNQGQPFLCLSGLYAPEGGGKHWSCRFSIGWPDGVDEDTSHGVDQVQAIILALQTIGARLYLSDYHRSPEGLYFETTGSGYGFPVPRDPTGRSDRRR